MRPDGEGGRRFECCDAVTVGWASQPLHSRSTDPSWADSTRGRKPATSLGAVDRTGAQHAVAPWYLKRRRSGPTSTERPPPAERRLR